MKHRSLLNYLLLLILLVLIFIAKFNSQNEVKSPVSSPPPKNLFFATSADHQITIYLYNITSGRFSQKDFNIDDFVSKNTHIKYDNANYSIQFNPQTNDIFILTDGYDGTKSNPCVNKDKTCKAKIYKANLNTPNTHQIFETDKEINNWIIDPNSNSIQFISYINNQNFLENISGLSGKLNYSQLFSGYVGLFVIPNDNFVYQTFTINSPNSKNSDLKIYKINPQNNVIEGTKTIDTNSFFTHQTSLSPNNQFLAYYKYDNQSKKRFLSIYDFTKNTVRYTFPVEDMQTPDLYWSQNSSQIVHQQNQSYWLFNLNTQKDEKIIEKHKVYGWNSDSNLLVTTNRQNQIILYNLSTKTEINFPKPINESDAAGLSWF